MHKYRIISPRKRKYDAYVFEEAVVDIREVDHFNAAQ